MARDERHILEGIAVDIVTGSMEYIAPGDRAQAWAEVRELTDAELVAWICDR